MSYNSKTNDNNYEPSAKRRVVENGILSTSQFTRPPNIRKIVYLDYNATTPLEKSVLDAIYATLDHAWGNPSSSYVEGRMAKRVINDARGHVGKMINSAPSEIIFTSGGTEANNMIFHSVVEKFKEGKYSPGITSDETGQSYSVQPYLPHFITLNIEHDSVILALRHLEQSGKIELTELPVCQQTGQVNIEDVTSALRWNTVLVTVMMANNETGVIQPIEKISEAIRQINRSRLNTKLPKVYMHTDAAQAIGKIKVDSNSLGVDFLTIVGHKFYGPRIGALFVKDLGSENGALLFPMFYGGGQEKGYRPGTENTGMIAGLGEACRLVTENLERYKSHMEKVRDYLENQLEIEFRGRININSRFIHSHRLPNTCNVSILGPNLQGRKILAEVTCLQASVGAACHSERGDKPSHILTACGISEDVAKNAIRLSVGRYTREADIDIVVQDLKDVVEKLSSL